jgi:hypothetical protein
VPAAGLYRAVLPVPTLGSAGEDERTFPRTIALIGLAGTLGAAAITGFFTLAANHGSPPPQPPATGYDGQMNTYDQGGDGHLITSSPLAVVC